MDTPLEVALLVLGGYCGLQVLFKRPADGHRFDIPGWLVFAEAILMLAAIAVVGFAIFDAVVVWVISITHWATSVQENFLSDHCAFFGNCDNKEFLIKMMFVVPTMIMIVGVPYLIYKAAQRELVRFIGSRWIAFFYATACSYFGAIALWPGHQRLFAVIVEVVIVFGIIEGVLAKRRGITKPPEPVLQADSN